MESGHDDDDQNAGEEGDVGCDSEHTVDEFIGYDGEVYELRRVRPKKNRNKAGNAVSS